MKNLLLILAVTLFSSSVFAINEFNNGIDSTKNEKENQDYLITDAEEDEFFAEEDSTEVDSTILNMEEVPFSKGNHTGESIHKTAEEEVILTREEMEEVPMVKGDRNGNLGQKATDEEEVISTIQDMKEVPMAKGNHSGESIHREAEEEVISTIQDMKEVPMMKGNHTGESIHKMVDGEETSIETIPTPASIYPNPSDGVFTIRFDQSEQGVTRVEILDMSGRTVFVQDLGQYSGNYQEQVNLREFGAGLYMVAIQQGNNRTVNKVIVK